MKMIVNLLSKQKFQLFGNCLTDESNNRFTIGAKQINRDDWIDGSRRVHRKTVERNDNVLECEIAAEIHLKNKEQL